LFFFIIVFIDSLDAEIMVYITVTVIYNNRKRSLVTVT